MKYFNFKKKKKGIASITIVLLLGFLSILVATSLFTYNAWRWENLENSIRKERYDNAIDSATLLQYILLLRQRNMSASEVNFYDSWNNYERGVLTTVSISTVDTLDSCHTVSLPAEHAVLPVKWITASNQDGNFFSQKSCCAPGIIISDELKTEEVLYTYSKSRCKNMNWPNLKEVNEPLMVSRIIQ